MTMASRSALSGHVLLTVTLLLWSGLAAPPAYSATATDKAEFDSAIDAVVARYQLPGIAVGVIENGEVTYVRTKGELVASSGHAVTSQTLFKIASNSKAMTSSVLARLVDAGKLRWDDPVVKYLPDFAMYDPWVTRNMQVSDLLVHHSGLPEGGGDLMLWPEPNAFTRTDIIHGLRYIKPAYSFRAGYGYDNLLYVVAGEVAAVAGGASYETLVRREVFQPIGLTRCQVGAWNRDEVGNVAQPHMIKNGRNLVVDGDDKQIPAITSAAAGGIRCSLDDMLTWARNWLVPTSRQLQWLSPEQRREVWIPRTSMPISKRRLAWDHSHFYSYGYGWRLTDVDSVWSASHTGTLNGMYSVMSLLPQRKAGFVVLINGDADAARTVLTEVLIKHFTSPSEKRSVASYADELANEQATSGKPSKPDTTSRHQAGISELTRWLGIYRDPWFGDIAICPRQDSVRFQAVKSPLMTGRLQRLGQRYLVDWDTDSVGTEAWLMFGAGAGKPVTLTMKKVDPEADFSSDYEDLAFTRVRDCE